MGEMNRRGEQVTRAGDVEWVMLGACDVSPPPRAHPRKGATKYPFDELERGHLMRVERRSLSAVRDAVRRYVAIHPGEQFLTWRGAGAAVMVKRVK